MDDRKDLESYIEALEDELAASVEREKRIADGMSFWSFLNWKFRSSWLYKDIVINPDSKMGKVIRSPRSIYRVIKDPTVRESLAQKKTLNGDGANRGFGDSLLEPWLIPLERRISLAHESLRGGKNVALYYVEKPDSSTFRYRCYNTFEVTLESKEWQAIYFFKNEIEDLKKLLPKCSVLILGRQSGQDDKLAGLISSAHRNNIMVGLDIDDLIFDTEYLDVMLDAVGGKVDREFWFNYFLSVQRMAEKVDYYIATNAFLAKKLEASFGKPCYIIKNSLNAEQIRASMVYSKQKKEGEDFRVGYFSGSPTHERDLGVAEPWLVKFLKKHRNTSLVVVGYMNFSDEMQKLVEKKRVKFLEFTDFRKLQGKMADVEVNIAPLYLNDFTNCKSELKFFEAAIAGTVTIASPSYTFKAAIRSGENGFLAEGEEWFSKLEYLYKNSQKRRLMARTAREEVLRKYYGENFLSEVEKVYERVCR